jgi:hypothetical protein
LLEWSWTIYTGLMIFNCVALRHAVFIISLLFLCYYFLHKLESSFFYLNLFLPKWSVVLIKNQYVFIQILLYWLILQYRILNLRPYCILFFSDL